MAMGRCMGMSVAAGRRAIAFSLLVFGALWVREPARAAGKAIAAVFPIEVKRVRLKQDVLDVLWETLTAKLTGAYEVVPKDKLAGALRQQKKRSFKQCYAKSCQIAVGQELAAKKAISTRISRIGGMCQVIIKVWDLKKATAERAAEAQGRCGEAGLLKVVTAAVGKLTGERASEGAAVTGGMRAKPGLGSKGSTGSTGSTGSGTQRCPRGMEVVSGHCCWPGQDWGTSSGRCIGAAQCPEGFVAAGRGCRPGCTQAGKVLVSGHCCWPGQDWGARAQECVGRPSRCPRGLRAQATGCGSPAPASKAGEVWVRLSGGSFEMGSASGDADEKPVHRVTLRAFAMLKTEVTVGQYRACVNAGACSSHHLDGMEWPGQAYKKSGYCNWSSGRGESHPVNCVDWGQARAFCKWAGGRLPSEAEWEYAARSGGQARAYPWGDEAADCSRAVMDAGGSGCGKKSTWPVCSKTAGNSAQGLCDLAGNVWEWTADCFQPSYAGAPADNRPRNNCTGQYSSQRVNRGGSWYYPARYLRAAGRAGSAPSARIYFLGLRCARTL